MIIQLLQTISKYKEAKLPEISNYIGLSVIKTLSLIAKINQYEPNLINEKGGYFKLSRDINWLSTPDIIHRLTQKNLAHNVIILNEVNSTNTYALKNISNYLGPIIISCELQNNGRGRFGRKWLSKISHDLTVSLIYQLPIDFNLPILPIIIAVSVNRLLKNYRISNKIKWPNDIYSHDEKVCGILVENIFRKQQNNVVIGIGLDNIGFWERNQLLVDLVSEVDNSLREYQLFGFPLLRREWLDNCLHHKSHVKLLKDDVIVATGVHQDIGEDGELIIQTTLGKQKFSSSLLSLIIEK